MILALVACGGKGDDGSDDTGSGNTSSVYAWCDISADGVCWNFLSSVNAAQYPDACDTAAGEYHTAGECPREDALGCCLVGTSDVYIYEYIYYNTEQNIAQQADIQHGCETIGGTWGSC